MSNPTLSQQDLYNLFITTLQSHAPQLTDTLDGSVVDALGGVFSIASAALQKRIIDSFNKTFFSLAHGPAVTGGDDDLQTLAVDRFGSAFARPGAVAALDTATFSRPTNTAGAVSIPQGTVIKTQPDANGASQRYTTDALVTLTSGGATDLSVSVGITALSAGAAGNAAAGTINVIESTLLDSTITCANAGNATGADAEDDAEYLATIQNLISSLAGATSLAIQAKAKTVAGVSAATPVEQTETVIAYNDATHLTSGQSFTIAKPVLYISDGTGNASPTLISNVRAALAGIKADGVIIDVQAGSGLTVNWTASITLNPSGPNYGTFQTDTSDIRQAMADYINNLPVGTGFVRATGNAAILAKYGPSGTNDLTAFTTSVPSGDVSATTTTKLVAGTTSIL